LSFIRDVQARAIREKGFAPDPDKYAYASAKLWDELEHKNRAGSEAVKSDLQDTLTLMRELGPFQNPVHLFGLVKYNREILEVARRSGYADESWVPFASATFGSDNAVTIRIRQHYVVIYNDGLFVLVDLISAQLSYALQELASGGEGSESLAQAAERAFDVESEIVQSLLTTITCFVTTGDPRRAVEKIADHLLPQDGNHRLLRDTALRFVVAHELGHVYLHHLEDAGQETIGPTQVSFRWKSEYEADDFAVKIAIQALADSRIGPRYKFLFTELLAVQVQPMLLVLVSSAKNYLEHGGIPPLREGEGTHPPSDLRFARVQARIDTALRDVSIAEDEDAAASALMAFILSVLLPPLKEECLKLRHAGVRPV